MISIIKIKCSSCGKEIEEFYGKNGEWWDKYINDNENICFNCIKNRPGFADDFKRLVGISIKEYENNICCHGSK